MWPALVTAGRHWWATEDAARVLALAVQYGA
jgi:hypothetical protein